MEEFDEKINLLNKVKCLNNELILKNGNIVFNTSIFHKIDKKTEKML